jgi:hypothetical protein
MDAKTQPPPDIDEAEPPDDELSALLLILPPTAAGNDDEDIDLVSVIMVGRGEHFMRRARDYQQRYAQAVAEWNEWDSGDEWGEAHNAKLDELSDKYDLGDVPCDGTRFRIVEVTQPS